MIEVVVKHGRAHISNGKELVICAPVKDEIERVKEAMQDGHKEVADCSLSSD